MILDKLMGLRKYLFLTFVFIAVSSYIFSQTLHKSEPKETYLGQKPPGEIPEVFAPGIISSEQFEFGITFSSSMNEIYFTRRPDYEGSDNRIYVSYFVGGRLSGPVLADFAKDCFEFIPVISPDGEKLFFYSERDGADKSKYDGNLWYCNKNQKGWSRAKFFENPANRNFIMMISLSKKGNIYFAGILNKKRGLFTSTLLNGEYTDPVPLPDYINELAPAHPFISSDESLIIFDAQVTGRGKPELFICFRNNDGSWSKPVNMGPEINKTKTEFAASVSPDGKYLFFHRRVNNNGDIYWVDTKIIDDFR